MPKFQVLAVGGVGLVLTGAMLGSGLHGYMRTQDTTATPVPEPAPTLQPSATPTPQSTPAAPIPQTIPKNRDRRTGTIATPGYDGANLRDAPSRKDAVIQGMLKPGTVVTLGQEKDAFVAITTDAGVKGWVHQSTIQPE
jgi:Bacterial SH3 domain